jgi:EF hand
MNKAFLIGLGLASSLAAPAFAQPGQPPADIHRADVDTRVRERFGRADLNHDGAITQDEITTIVGMMQANGAPPQAAERIQAMFARDAQNGRITIADIVQRQLATFDAADANHDGTLTVAEQQAARAAAGAEQGQAPAAPHQ